MKSVKGFPSRRRCNVITVKQAKSNAEESCEQEDDDRFKSLLRALSPITTSMRIFGLFFLAHDSGGKKRSGQRSTFVAFSGPGHVYASVVLIAMWLNVIRLFSMFMPNPGPAPTILWRLVALTWTTMAAMVQTAYYRACTSRQMLSLLTFFSTIITPACFASVRRHVVVLTILAWLKVAINSIFISYVLFTTTNSPTDDLLAPITTLIRPRPSDLPIFKCVYAFVHLYVSVAAYLPMAFYILVAYVFCHHFKEVNRKLRNSMKDTASFVENFESLRRDHQMLSRYVSKADKFICLGSAAYVTVHIFTTICNLYNLIWAKDIAISPIFTVLTMFWIIASFLGLSAVSFGGIMVNNAVSWSVCFCRNKLYYSSVPQKMKNIISDLNISPHRYLLNSKVFTL